MPTPASARDHTEPKHRVSSHKDRITDIATRKSGRLDLVFTTVNLTPRATAVAASRA
jgi:predicted GIY-YIG superfamily endonuclease